MLKKSILLCYLLLVTVLSLYPSSGLPRIELFPNADKLIHAGMYAGFTFLMFLAWPEKFSGKKQFLPFLAVFIWGFSMEILQGIMNLGRSFDLLDELANCLGFFPGWFAWKWLGKKQFA